jgi:hypothetical protein
MKIDNINPLKFKLKPKELKFEIKGAIKFRIKER